MSAYEGKLGAFVRQNKSSARTFREEVYRIVTSAEEVIKELGFGHDKTAYESALGLEFITESIPYEQHHAYDITYKGHKVGEYVADIVSFNAIIVGIEVIAEITDRERAQMISHLKTAGLPIGLILNFANPELEWEQIML